VRVALLHVSYVFQEVKVTKNLLFKNAEITFIFLECLSGLVKASRSDGAAKGNRRTQRIRNMKVKEKFKW
jgi:hypothetical protein